MGKVLTVRVDDDLARWAEGYAAERGATRAQIHEAALRGFREVCASGVPELPPAKSGGRPKGDESAVADLGAERAAKAVGRAALERERLELLAQARASVVRRGS